LGGGASNEKGRERGNDSGATQKGVSLRFKVVYSRRGGGGGRSIRVGGKKLKGGQMGKLLTLRVHIGGLKLR